MEAVTKGLIIYENFIAIIDIEDDFCSEAVQTNLKSTMNKIEKRLAEIRERESKWDSISKKIEIAAGRAQKRIKLDVGGRLFSANKETLMSLENTYFYGLVANSDKYKPLDDGSFFIERNPLVFDRILDYLRTGKFETLELTTLEMKVLVDDLDYYCIPLPKELRVKPVGWDIKKKPNSCTFSDNDSKATKSADQAWNCGIIGDKAVDKYTVRVDNRGSNGDIMIGFTTGNNWNPNGINYTTTGWFMYVINGSLYAASLVNSPYTTAIQTGDYITVIREGTKIRFEKNKVNLGVVSNFTVPDYPLFPAIDIHNGNSIVTLVDNH